ncbi:hypothetical protein [Chryseobacterium sp. c4a]|uniref:hypothetical protein n=1 Tax=Chryseobacterium sp. c4a TaxID=1573582 RepID=UPI00135A0F0D|nr:hypothetical protein [Chryseobacterium sp. c4a]
MAITSCSSSNDEIETEQKQEKEIVVGNVNKVSWYFPFMYPATEQNDPNYYFEYDTQNRVSKKVGGYISAAQETGFVYVLSNRAYTNVIYNNNLITATDYVSSSNGVNVTLLKKKVFEIDNQGRIVKCTVFNKLNTAYEELIYHYDNSGKLTERLTHPPGSTYYDLVDRFTYDNNGNLINAKTSYLYNDVEVKTKSEVQFSNYDNVPNSFKKFGIFDEFLNISLSKNNPQKRFTMSYNENTGQTTEVNVTWTNQYNADGTLKVFY